MIKLKEADFLKRCEELEKFTKFMLRGQSDRAVCSVLCNHIREILKNQDNPKQALDQFIHVLSLGIK